MFHEKHYSTSGRKDLFTKKNTKIFQTFFLNLLKTYMIPLYLVIYTFFKVKKTLSVQLAQSTPLEQKCLTRLMPASIFRENDAIIASLGRSQMNVIEYKCIQKFLFNGSDQIEINFQILVRKRLSILNVRIFGQNFSNPLPDNGGRHCGKK